MPRARVAGAAVAALGVGLVALALHTRPFLLSHLEVTGLRQVTLPEVRADLGLPAGAYTWQLRPWILRSRLEADPLIASARAQLAWPGGLRIAIVERTPAALLLEGGDVWEVDRSGRLLRALPDAGGTTPVSVPGVGNSVPVVSGLPLPSPQAGALVASPELGPALAVAGALGGTYPALVARVTAAPGGAVGLVLRDGATVSYGDGSQAGLKTQELLGALAYFQGLGETVASCDLASTRTPACTVRSGPTSAAPTKVLSAG